MSYDLPATGHDRCQIALEQLQVSRNGKQFSVTNTGNTNVLFSDGKQCLNTETPEDCSTLASRRVYPGNTWTIELPHDHPVSFKLTSFEGIREQAFD